MPRKGEHISEEQRRKLKERVFSPEQRRNMSEAARKRIRKPHSLESRKKMSESKKGNNYNLGRKHTAEARANMSKSKMGNKSRTGMPHSAETRAKMCIVQRETQNRPEVHAKLVAAQHRPDMIALRKQQMMGNKHSLGVIPSAETRAKMSASRTGAKSPLWQGGKSAEPYTLEWRRKQLRHYIRTRDRFTCQLCGRIQQKGERSFAVHHIDYNKKNCADENLITLCHNCHTKTNVRREYWTRYFQALMAVGTATHYTAIEVQGGLF